MRPIRTDFVLRACTLSMRALIALAGALLIIAGRTNAASIIAASPSLIDVKTAVAAASEGDTVVVPAGTASWTSCLMITKGITLIGATTVTNAGTQNPTMNDATIIRDESPVNTTSSGLIKVTLSPSQAFRLTGFTFKYGSRTARNNHGVVLLSSTGSSPHLNMRVDHCHFDQLLAPFVELGGWVYGVADHNYLVSGSSSETFLIFHPGYGGRALGDGSWTDFPWFGTNKFFFIEDNTWVGNGAAISSGASDGNFGGRYVIRHNYIINSHTGSHGTEGNTRGVRSAEVYDNTYNSTIAYTAQFRSGTALVHDNVWVGKGSPSHTHHAIVIYRENNGVSLDINSNPFRCAEGSNSWDVNDTEGDGTYIEGHSPHLFESGTVSSGTGTGGTMTDTSKNWTPNKWVGYSIKQTNPSAPSNGKGSYITANTNNTITFYTFNSNRGATLGFVAGDTYQIRKVLVALDQVGRGKGDLLGGSLSSRANTVAGGQHWAHQSLEPAFSWNNVGPNNIAYGFDSGAVPSQAQGKDYFNLGKGLQADSTPSQVSSTYTASLNGADYTGTYTYPHPLTTGASVANPPLPPSNLAIVP